jgi:hypothetical protein
MPNRRGNGQTMYMGFMESAVAFVSGRVVLPPSFKLSAFGLDDKSMPAKNQKQASSQVARGYAHQGRREVVDRNTWLPSAMCKNDNVPTVVPGDITFTVSPCRRGGDGDGDWSYDGGGYIQTAPMSRESFVRSVAAVCVCSCTLRVSGAMHHVCVAKGGSDCSA